MRRTLIGLLGIVLVAGACSKGVSGPQKFAVYVDAPSSAANKFQTSAFFPGLLKARPGDTIEFDNLSTEAPHTISFGIAAKRANQPLVVTAHGENAVVHDPCYAPSASATLVTCPTKTFPAYAGTGYWNSGFLEPIVAPKAQGPKKTTLKLASSISAGTYTYVCILHPLMSGAIQVVAKDGDRIAQKDVLDEAKKEARGERDKAEAIAVPKLQNTSSGVTITAGWGDNVTSINRYSPAKVSVKTGTLVSWTNGGVYEPHTITFENRFKSPGDPGSTVPGGVRSGTAYTGGFSNSGILGPKGGPFPTGPFSLRFTKAGTYTYSCVFHPGQSGTITVT